MCTEKIICPVCGKQRPETYFYYYIGKDFGFQKECHFCFNYFRKLDAYLAKVLEGVRIPYYETPIKKYPIPNPYVATNDL